MGLVDYERLLAAMKWFMEFVTSNQNDSDIAFNNGWLKETEGYKYEIYANAHKALAYDKWTREMIGTGKILDCVMSGYNQKSNKKFNNIVQFQSITEFKSKAVKEIKKSEDILYRLYTNDDPAKAFDDACVFWGKRFPELSYLLFMKDRDKYLPVKTRHHKKCFSILNIDSEFLGNCSWKNYNMFIQIHEEIRRQLEEYLGMEISLLDAHSFVWVMQHATEDFSNVDSTLPEDLANDNDPYTSTVVKAGKEGKVSYHYVAKYERKPQNRAAAIRIHGCKCMACGFDFEKAYGELGKGFIEVHHNKALHTLKEEVEINPETDLTCLCANCHRMVHKKRGAVLSLEQLMALLSAQLT